MSPGERTGGETDPSAAAYANMGETLRDGEISVAAAKATAEGTARMGIFFDPAPSEAEAEFVRSSLDEFNLGFAPPYGHRKLEIVAREGGKIVAGLVGGTYWSWLYVDRLWVAEDRRGTGLGSELLARAEAEAAARGCVGAYLDTMSFQAKGFYEKAGYREVGRIDDLPPGCAKHLLAKRLVPRT